MGKHKEVALARAEEIRRARQARRMTSHQLRCALRRATGLWREILRSETNARKAGGQRAQR